MKKITVDGFTLTEEFKQRLLAELKDETVKTDEDLERYLSGYWYTKDMAHESHLLLSPSKKKQNFALPFEEASEEE